MTSLNFAAPGNAQRRLIEAAQQGDRGAVEHVIRRYEPLVRRVVWRVRPPFGYEREDLAQEARIGLIAAIRAWQPERGPFPAFADRCVTNQVVLAAQAAGRHKHQILSRAVSWQGAWTTDCDPAGERLPDRLLDAVIATGDATTDPESRVIVKEQLSTIVRALPTLSPRERLALAGTLSGESYEDVARAINGTQKAAWEAVCRARRKLGSASSQAA
jgi:RNA polymerase sigma-H factor